jgi:sigma-B regulation protein RsbU (phosphoserine phosphatase)
MPAKILVVDDEPQLERLILQRFRKQIKNKEYHFAFSKSAAEALELLKQNSPFDIVMTDINMPQMDGLTFLAKLKEIKLPVKTVMVSAYGDMRNIRTAMNQGAYDFVTKPIDFEDLKVTLDKAGREVELLKLAAQARKELDILQQELTVASEIQQSILPKKFTIFPDGSNFEISAKMIPAQDVGGDFYDFFSIDDDHLGFVIGDVSGKGMPAALFMAISRTLLKAIALRGDSTSQCLKQVNYILSQDNPKAMFVTLFYGVLNNKTGEVNYCNGGHNPPCLLLPDGRIHFLEESRNTALGIEENLEYQSGTFGLEPGSSLILYTDGIPEAVDIQRQEFSIDQLKEYLHKCTNESSKGIIEGLIKAVNTFAGDVPQSDDITALVIKNNQ